ncbi:hypothetical protein GQ600_22475 [Phytophthora cactorum]|nr:hypothetical protein GQ600_22475 [Phytophthora cactorum]
MVSKVDISSVLLYERDRRAACSKLLQSQLQTQHSARARQQCKKSTSSVALNLRVKGDISG